MRRPLVVVSVAVAAALLAAGCSEEKPSRSEAGEAGSSSTTAPAETTVTSATTATTAATATTAVTVADPCALKPQAPPTGPVGIDEALATVLGLN